MSGVLAIAAEKPKTGRSLAEARPDLAAEWHEKNGALSPHDVAVRSKTRVWWRCTTCSIPFEAAVTNRTAGRGCRPCGLARAGRNRSKPKPGESLAEKFPQLALEWHAELNGDLRATDVRWGANRLAWWSCRRCGRTWEAMINSRTQGAGCLPCSALLNAECLRKPGSGKSLADQHPELLESWHVALNGNVGPKDVKPRSNDLRWWACPMGHDPWQATPSSRVRGTGCRRCAELARGARNAAPAPGESFADRFPELVAEWDIERNNGVIPSQIKPFSNKNYAWKCPRCGHRWKALASNRAQGAGCAVCHSGGFHPERPAYVYLLGHPGLHSWKVGISAQDGKRLGHFRSKGWTQIHLESFSEGADARNVEAAVHRWWRKDLNLPIHLERGSTGDLHGYTETIADNELSAWQIIARIKSEARRVRRESAAALLM